MHYCKSFYLSLDLRLYLEVWTLSWLTSDSESGSFGNDCSDSDEDGSLGSDGSEEVLCAAGESNSEVEYG